MTGAALDQEETSTVSFRRRPAVFDDSCTAVVFFPGLGSRSAYRDAGMDSIGSDFGIVADVYEEAAAALGISRGPAGLALTSSNLPEDPVERQGFIGAAFLVHNLAIYAEVHERAVQSRSLRITAYTGESFGMLASAVASGSLSVRDGAILARAFTPLLLASSNQHAGGDFGRSIERFVRQYSAGTVPVPEPASVIAVTAEPDELHRFLTHVVQRHGDDVEVHKRYSRSQVNLYVRTTFIHKFVRILRSYPEVTGFELKEPTKFLAHSRKMIGARESFGHYMDAHGVCFNDPHTPLISNSGDGFLITGEHVRRAILAITNEVMDSQRTVELIDELRPDVVAEIGRGGKSLQLLKDNAARSEVTGISTSGQARNLVRGTELVHRLNTAMRNLTSRRSDQLAGNDLALLREIVEFAAREAAFDRHLRRMTCALAFDADKHPERDISPALRRFRETLQNTLAHRRHLRDGELVLYARLRKRLTGKPDAIGQAYTELRIVTAHGKRIDREITPDEDTEAFVIHFERPRRPQIKQVAQVARSLLETQPVAQRVRDSILDQASLDDGPAGQCLEATIARADATDLIVHQVSMFELLKRHRPGLFGQSHVFLEGSDPLGWLIAIVAGDAVSAGAVVELAAHLILGRADDARIATLLDRVCDQIGDARLPLLSLEGIPVVAQRDLRAETRAFFSRGMANGDSRGIDLNASCTVVALGHARGLKRLDTSPHLNRALVVHEPEELWRHGLNPSLDQAESRVLLTASRERRMVAAYARKRHLLHSTVSSYILPGETLVGFGDGGSESMTLFFRRDESRELLVRKVLSEALTTARWDPQGTGPMLPPFMKAKRQAEYLCALPSALRDYFPQVLDIVERRLQLPDKAGASRTFHEVIYEMTFVPGVEVGQYVRTHTPPAAVVARLYEQIMLFVHQHVHTQRRVASPGGVLEEQYFRKIEDRLDLCRRTAPRTFGSVLLDSDEIVINGRPYRNHRVLLEALRAHQRFRDVLEPPTLALVIGDTNTENIKIGTTEPLHRAQRLIESNASDAEIQEALASITASSIGLKFLDPRAIGYRSDGASVRDDPMYDNKPWHNSIGHYDEIHNELFDLSFSVGTGGVPEVTISFHADNPYRKAYRVRDVVEQGDGVRPDHPDGIEDYFAQVMNAVYQLDDAASAYRREDPHWITRFVFTMGTHFTAMPPFHFESEIEGTLVDAPEVQRRPIAIYCEGIKWLNWALEMLEGTRSDFLGVPVAAIADSPGRLTTADHPEALAG